MIGKSVKTYFKNMKYLVPLLGILFLTLIFGCKAAGEGLKYTEEWFLKMKDHMFGSTLLMALGVLLIHAAVVSVSLNAQAFLFGGRSWVNYLPDENKQVEEKKE